MFGLAWFLFLGCGFIQSVLFCVFFLLYFINWNKQVQLTQSVNILFYVIEYLDLHSFLNVFNFSFGYY